MKLYIYSGLIHSVSLNVGDIRNVRNPLVELLMWSL